MAFITFKLKDYRNSITEFGVPLDFFKANTNLTIVYTVQSGDEVVYIYNDNKLLKKYDANIKKNSDGKLILRAVDILDDLKVLSLEELLLLNVDKRTLTKEEKKIIKEISYDRRKMESII